MIGPPGREVRIVAALPRLRRNPRRLLSGQGGEQFIEPPGPAPRRRIALGPPVQPGKMGEQQAAVIAAAAGDLLAMIEHRLLHPVERAVGQHLLGMIAREDQRRVPPGGKGGRAASAQIDRLGRDADAGGSCADRAAGGERGEEAGLALGGEGVVAQGGKRGR